MQEVEDKGRPALEESAGKYVPIDKVKERPQQERQAIPHLVSQPSLAFSLRTPEVNPDLLLVLPGLAPDLLEGFTRGVAIVLCDPVADSLAVLVNEIMV